MVLSQVVQLGIMEIWHFARGSFLTHCILMQFEKYIDHIQLLQNSIRAVIVEVQSKFKRN